MNPTLVDLPANQRHRLCTALEQGVLSSPYTVGSLQAIGVPASADVLSALNELADLGVSDRAAAAWFRAVEHASSYTSAPDVVWSGPEVPDCMLAILDGCTKSCSVQLSVRSGLAPTHSSYGPRAFSVLAFRMDERLELHVTVLLNIQRKRGDTTSPEQLVRKFADSFWKFDWPGDRRPTVFYDPRSLDMHGPGSVLHAKAVVVDDEALFVTSANLTEAALDRNIELGLLVRDRSLALTVASHFRVLIDRRLLRPLPAE